MSDGSENGTGGNGYWDDPERAQRRCPAPSKRTGQQCGQVLPLGAVVCRWHGGNVPRVKAKQEERLARMRAEGEMGKLLAEMGETPLPNPLDGLEATYARCARWCAGLAVLVGELDTPLGVNWRGEQVVHPLVALEGEWLDRYARVQKIALDVGIELRREQLEASDLTALFESVAAALAVVGVNPEQREAFGVALASELRRRDAGVAIPAG